MIYFLLTEFRNFLFDKEILRSHKLPGFTISVGNIELGGTGKTPTVIAICKLLLSRGQRPVILTRGYKSGLKNLEWALLKDGKYLQSPRLLMADEAMECSCVLNGVPVVLGANRFGAAQEFLKVDKDYHPTHWILDDGFQHRRLQRNVDFVLVTPSFSLSPWAVLPFGRQRESGKNVARATAVLLSKFPDPVGNKVKDLTPYNPTVLPLEFKFEGLSQVSGEVSKVGQNPIVVTGIAKADVLYANLRHYGISFKKTFQYRDHERIPWETFADQDTYITTAKDFYREAPPSHLKIFIAANSAILNSKVVEIL